MKNCKNEKRSEAFELMLASGPPWIQRHGMTIIALMVALLLISSGMLKYQNVVVIPVSLSCNSANGNKIVVRVNIPLTLSKDVKKGQKVDISIKGYSIRMFGVIRGKVKTLFMDKDKHNMNVDIVLPLGLMTSRNRRIPYSQNMKATVKFIINETSILAKIMIPIEDVFKV